MKSSVALGLALLATSASARRVIYVKGGADFEAECLHKVEPGDTCYLGGGNYYHDGITVIHGTEHERITITGHHTACIKGSNTQDRVLQIAHDYYTVEGLCFDGEHINKDGEKEHVSTAIYVLGADKKSKKSTRNKDVLSSVTGFQLFDNEIKNFSGECVHFRYFVTDAVVAGNTIQFCGKNDFENGGGGKVGEGIYLGTAPDQTRDGKTPEPKLRTGDADGVEVDVCTNNWIHHNTFMTHGNECVDVKEGSTGNMIEYNICEYQRDPNSAGFGSRGSGNTFRFNKIANCVGAGFRVGGHVVNKKRYGQGNHMYGNQIRDCDGGAFRVMAPNQGTVCENTISGVGPISVGTYGNEEKSWFEWQFSGTNSTRGCSSYPYPDDLVNESNSPSPAPGDEDSEPEFDTIDTNESAGSSGLGGCGSVVAVESISLLHKEDADSSTDFNNLFDGDNTTYFSVRQPSTYFELKLMNETMINGISIGFFMKAASEARIQTFSVEVEGHDGWSTPIAPKESSGKMTGPQHFPFDAHEALSVRIRTHGNTFNMWSAFTLFEVCTAGTVAVGSNARFNGIGAGTARKLLSPKKLEGYGSDDDVRDIVDGDYNTRWSTLDTKRPSDQSNGKVMVTLDGDTYVDSLNLAFFDGLLAHQNFSVYVQSAINNTWTPVILNEQAAKEETMQSFGIHRNGVSRLYIVGKGNDVGDYTKISEIEVWGG